MRKREELELQEYKDKVSRPKNAKRNKEHQRKSCYSQCCCIRLQKLLQFHHYCESCYSFIIIAKAVTVSYSLLVMRLNSLVSSLSLYKARISECLGPSWIIENHWEQGSGGADGTRIIFIFSWSYFYSLFLF